MGVPKHWVYYIPNVYSNFNVENDDRPSGFLGQNIRFSIFQPSICRSTNEFHRWAQITHIKPVNSIITRTRHRYGTPDFNSPLTNAIPSSS